MYFAFMNECLFDVYVYSATFMRTSLKKTKEKKEKKTSSLTLTKTLVQQLPHFQLDLDGIKYIYYSFANCFSISLLENVFRGTIGHTSIGTSTLKGRGKGSKVTKGSENFF